MANKPITPTTPVSATSTVAGSVRVTRRPTPSGVAATSTVNGSSAVRLQWPGYGPYQVPYVVPAAPVTPAPPSTNDFATAVYNQLNLDKLVGTDDWINLLTDPLFVNGVDGWTCDANFTLAQSQEQSLFGP